MIFLKSVAGGVVAVVAMWVIVIVIYSWRLSVMMKKKGMTGLAANAGGFNSLLHMPLVLILLTVAFGVGLYLTAR